MAKIKLTIGDKVQVYRKVTQEKGWDNVWVDTMDSTIGMVGTVTNLTSYGVEITTVEITTSYYSYDYPYTSLKHV